MFLRKIARGRERCVSEAGEERSGPRFAGGGGVKLEQRVTHVEKRKSWLTVEICILPFGRHLFVCCLREYTKVSLGIKTLCMIYFKYGLHIWS